MSAIAVLSPQSEVFNNYQSQVDTASKVGSADNTASNVTASDVKEFLAFATLAGSMNVILNGQSLMNSNGSLVPALAVPVQLGDKMSAEQTQSIVAMSVNVNAGDAQALELVASSAANVMDSTIDELKENTAVAAQIAAPVQDGDANKLERIAATGAAQFAAPAATAVNSKAVENTKSSTEPAVTNSVSSATPARSHAAVDGGTDIEAPVALPPVFTKIMGDPRILELNNTMVRVLNEAENLQNLDAARSSQRAVNSAVAAGNKMISSAQQNMTGAITAGVMSMAMQTATSGATIKAVKAEKDSINFNLKNADRLEKVATNHQSAIDASSDNMIKQGHSPDRNVTSMMSQPNAETRIAASSMRNDHNATQLNTMRMRAITDAATQANHAASNMIQASYGVKAAEESKESEVARANQTVNNEVSNTHQQTGKKTSETQAALQRVLETTLSNNNSAASTVAERMR